MKAKIVDKKGATLEFEFDGSESGLWKIVGKYLLDSPVPNEINVSVGTEEVLLRVKKRGSFVKDGVEKPSMYVEAVGMIHGLAPSTYKDAYLVCVNPESNNYKAYILRPVGNCLWCEYGSIDDVARGKARRIKNPYPVWMYWVRYYEKISKGYVDQSDVFFAPYASKKAPSKASTSARAADRELFDLLCGFAQHKVTSTCVAPVTVAQIEKSQKLLKSMRRCKKLSSFNERLRSLIAFVPRKRDPLHDDVARFFAKSDSDFGAIIEREEDLLDAMRGASASTDGSFASKDIDVFLATQKQRDEVLAMLGDTLKGKVKRVWRIKPHAQEKRFADYCKRHGIKRIRKFWHGSRNENWASIILNGLELHPNARITGKMFGDGIYFAPSPAKSFNYTSYQGTYWAHGTSSTGIMGIYATAYGDPYEPTSYGGNCEPAMKASGKDCVHALASKTGLRNDEVVFFSENAMCINYLVEFA